MPTQIDHLILNVNDLAKSIEFYTGVMGFAHEGEREGTPFSVIRVNQGFMIQLAPFGTKGGEHLAFAVSPSEFEQIFQRIRDGGIQYGDSFDTVGNGCGPGDSGGVNGVWKAVYFFDPDRHLIEIGRY